MRIPRKYTINHTGIFHKIWKGHNNQYILKRNSDKNAYLDMLKNTYTNSMKSYVRWHSYCVMNNHIHETGSLVLKEDDGSSAFSSAIRTLSKWMRNAHSRFGRFYNNKYMRCGAVLNDRTKTKEIQNHHTLLTVMFYGDANPVRSGIVKHPRAYYHSSYRFYAYGKTNSITKCLLLPSCYIALGKTPKERQRKYRKLCNRYLQQHGLINPKAVTTKIQFEVFSAIEKKFIGNEFWYQYRLALQKKQLCSVQKISKPPIESDSIYFFR